MGPSTPCRKCLDMRCACGGSYAAEATYLGVWAKGTSNQGAWCECCLKQFIETLKLDADVRMRTLALRFLVTLATNPDQYVREEAVDPTNWNGQFPCWHPTNCETASKHMEKLKKSRSKCLSRISKELTGFEYAYWPCSYDQVKFSSPFPYIVGPVAAKVILENVDAALYPPNPHVVLNGGNRTKGDIDHPHV